METDRSGVMPEARRGFVFLTSLFVLAGMATFIAIGLSRSVTELSASSRYVDTYQAFHLAEAGFESGFDAVKANPALNPPYACPDTPLPAGVSRCRIDDLGDGTWLIQGIGFVPDVVNPIAQETVRVTVRPPLALLFPYTVGAQYLTLAGNATLGDPFERVTLYLDGLSPIGSKDLGATSTDEVWAQQVDFANPTDRPLPDLCPLCYDPIQNPGGDPGVFPPAPSFSVSGTAPASLPAIDLMPYYLKAKEQYDANPTDSCNRYHYLGAPAGSSVTLDGADCPNGLNGVIYVERGVNVMIKNSFTLRGTLVHEGIHCDIQQCDGTLELASNGNLTIDSRQGFGKGMAIVGAPLLNFKGSESGFSRIAIDGFIMAGGSYNYNGQDASAKFRTSELNASGTIAGGIIGVSANTWFLPNAAGPVNVTGTDTSPLTVGFWGLRIGATSLTFSPLTELPPGFSPAPDVLMWGNGPS